MKRCLIFYNSTKPRNIEILEKLKKFLKKNKINVESVCVLKKCKVNLNADFAVAIGGDGTVLYASHYVIEKDIPLISIKGGGLGFLSSVEEKDLDVFMQKYLEGEYKVLNRNMLKISFEDKMFLALNDCVIKSKDLRTFYVDVYYSAEYVSTYFSDGIIISTPTGSTAYNLSCWGPIIHPHSRCVVITPISPHTLTHRPVVLPDNSEISIIAREKENLKNENIVISIDGQKNFHIFNSKVKVNLAPKVLKTIVGSNYSYFEVLRKKLSWGEREDK